MMPYIPNPYPQSYIYSQGYQMPYQQQNASYSPAPPSNNSIIWVDGEVGAKAYQLPPGISGPVALWDTNDTVIFLKSVNQMGIPNPLQKIRYEIEENKNLMLPNGQSGTSAPEPDMSQYVTKADLEKIKQELRNAISSANGNNNQNNGNRGNR